MTTGLYCTAIALAALTSLAATNVPTRITAGPEWIPLRAELDIEPGSALDFSSLGFLDAPAGKHGHVIARPDGQFAFEKLPRQAQRFYGVNLCFGAHYLSKAEADRLADRLVRLGYNALRIHHYERDLVQGQSVSTVPNPTKLDQFDYLCAALIKRGIYLTTDLYVSRPVPWREIGVDKDGSVPMDTFKVLVPVHPGAYRNWCDFSRELLTHVNPYTGKSYANEPALAWLAMINEGNMGNFLKQMQTIPEWKQAWNVWLRERFANRDSLASAWAKELKVTESQSAGSVELPENIHSSNPRTREFIMFLAEKERAMVSKMKTFLHDDLGCRALVSNASSWTRFVTDQGAREVYDYVDDHFYVDHPQFLEQSWRLPSKCPNTSPIAEGAPGGRSIAFTRLFAKPFTVTEYNYSGPGRFRGVGGILTGALGALQGWGGIWRFAYSHSRDAMFEPSRINYFDMASDPLSQAAERASLCLFLRGDLEMANHSAAIVVSEADLAKPPAKIPNLAPKWHWLAWVTRVGTDVVQKPEDAGKHDLLMPLGWQTPQSVYSGKVALDTDPYQADDAGIVAAVQKAKLVRDDSVPQPRDKFLRSENREVTVNGPEDMLVLDTAKTAGGYAPVGKTVETSKGGVRFTSAESDATLWVSSLDNLPIRDSRRLLVTHLTDLQNTDILYREPARQVLLDWGRMPHLVRAGKAEVSIKVRSPEKLGVWALSPGGKRIGEIDTVAKSGTLSFTADVGADAQSGARMLYEISVK